MLNESRIVTVESTLPKAWEESPTFNDLLYEWMGHAPWFAISAVTHVMVFLLLAVIPWNLFDTQEETIVQATLASVEDIIYDDPVEDLIKDVEPDEPITDPVLQDSDIVETTDDSPFDEQAFETDEPFINPFDGDNTNPIIGIGGGGGGKSGNRFKRGKPRGGDPTAKPLADGLKWLADHQDEDGKWDSDGFMKHDPAGDRTTGPGQPEHDVGVTGLALLAFLGDGHTTRHGMYRDQVARGVKWLREQQDHESGLIGEQIGHSFMYDHSIATLALCEAYYFSKSPIHRGPAQRAISFVTTSRNPYGVWRYDASPQGDNDSSVTGWMVFALKSAEESGLTIDSQAFNDAITWFDEVSDPATGRVGYDGIGTASARVTGVNSHYPTDKTETMTAVGLLCRFFLGQDPADEEIMVKHADLLLRNLPEWSNDGLTNDMYYWYYGTYAMYQMGGRHWKTWNKAMKRAVVESQRKDGAADGSWDPNGPWGFSGGRVYATAKMSLCLEVYFRYSKLLGAR